jgi:DNA-binding XRE family transcriptional regulator
MTVQIIEIAGQKMAMLPVADYERLIELAEDQADIAAAERAEQRRLEGEEYIPFELVNAIINGENALKLWREYRGMSQRALAEAAECRLATISELENGRAQGKPSVWRGLAEALDVTVDDILPLD